MKITIYGSGYVGLVTGACLADAGNDVLCADIDQSKVDSLKQGKVPFYEPGLSELVESAMAAEKIDFTSDMDRAVAHAELQFIAVGTPPDEDGSADLTAVLKVAETIAAKMSEDKIIVDKSTVPVGTADRVYKTVADILKAKNSTARVRVVSNPEFLKEGAAVGDFMRPGRIVIGTDSEHAIKTLRRLYEPFCRRHDRIKIMDVRSAELTKYAANAMLATKISFMNELSQIAEKIGADIELVRQGIGSDPRIGYHFIYPGCGYGGSCFPKDISALRNTAKSVGMSPVLLDAVAERNERQKQVLFEKLARHYNNDLRGKKIAVWGLAFKPNTDDMREASSRVLLEKLWQSGAQVSAHDPEALDEARRIYGERADLHLVNDPMSVLVDAHALVICTEWKAYRGIEFSGIKDALIDGVVVDGRNMYDPALVAESGLTYYSIGRKTL